MPAVHLPRRAGRRTNLGLLALLLLAGGTGVLAFGVGTPLPARLVAAAHGAAGLGLLLLVPWKAVVVRRSRSRPAGRRDPVAAWALAVLLLLTLVTGVVHTATGATLGGVGLLQVHVAAGVGTGALLVVHAVGSRQRPRPADLSRRALLRAGALAAGSVALWGAVEGGLRLAGAPGARRLGTGSHERGSGDPAAMPVTQWFTDTVPADAGSDPDDTVELVAGSRTTRLRAADLDRGDRVTAVLDCTGGWYAEQQWRGVRLDRLLAGLDLPDGGSVDVVAVSGYRRRLPLRDAGSLLLATHCAGRPLSAGHGAPVRLVAPGRRGYWWVKWVRRVEVVDAPWWAQPPVPLR
ncbi:Oxidoreductase molybdopterin binding domain-containing protein [Geodermatophilus telluris]|uniref:Oxidoreductase molybdopterin binding domain-containing protein n=1 Tax=Geodermatophilus telluris TaxID=1190417 RepID=A0A1G6S268_9ACTN|nr:molybdopterin-dependent oxidoreductase [Geodermatophilus telluris]SDD11000.1 Oxidoreductase molybdopterin binding domain-containing protein [Geodermatophilus telluris]